MQTEALVLKTWPYSESSTIAWLLLKDEGAVRALAKGARRLKGRTAAALDIFSRVQVGLRLSRKDGLANLGSVTLKQTWPYLRSDLNRLALASTALEIMGHVASISPHEPFFFAETIHYLDLLAETPGPGSLTALLLLRLLCHAGYPPRLEDGLDPETLPAYLIYDFDEGTFRASGEGHGTARAVRLPRDVVAPILANMPARPLESAHLFGASQGRSILRWLIRVWEDHLRQELVSKSFLEEMVLNTKST